MYYDVIVIGGGASGMMAAGRAADRGKKVLLLEKNKELGAKLKITGGGRCNITNAEEDKELLLSNYGEAKPFLHSPFSKFGVRETFSFFESRGLPLIVETRKRAFPRTERALDVLKTLKEYLKKGGVVVRLGAKVEKIQVKNNRIISLLADGKEINARSYILATGGKSHPETGSTGDGFLWLKKIGHTVKEPTPSIVPLAVENRWVKKLAGITLPAIRISFFLEEKRMIVLKGNVLCTHFGLSGPLILNTAAAVADLLHAGAVTATIDLFPAENIGSLDKKIVTIFDAHKNKTLKSVWKEIVPPGTGQVLLSLLKGMDPQMKVHSITKEERRRIVDLLKGLPITISGLMGYDRAVVADGGLLLSEVDTRTMCSKKYENLYVTGDLLHISRPSGGYSLQLCWTTGYVAGSNA